MAELSTIGFGGTGLMGAAMVRRLLQAGHRVMVWNRTPGKAAALVAEGATLAADPAELTQHCETVILCLTDTRAVEQVAFGQNGLKGLNSLPGALRRVVDHSSISPTATRAIAQRLKAETGADWVDAPVSGGIAGAANGALVVMAGGDAAAIEHASPALRAYARAITRMGDSGAGQVAKLCNQTVVATTLCAIAEAVSLAQRSGIDASALSTALAGGWADSVLLQTFVPRMTTPPAQSIGALATMLKDLDNVAEAMQQAEVHAPVLMAVQERFRQGKAQGLGEADLSQIVRVAKPA
ncbi:MAG: NAD-binding protein [Hydrogenophaga sp.]|uniref:NAD(P)-dependent oxidoreductase n=1 Tax=Hydrogenophaga sp. TaxID=1904254 RepID=UPI0016BAC552|nr:NAD(P)-dependent oxidoreductase [Hydrogenophaga sp.]NIM43441.1 NAD-binding protein [Hydrogenophaga sp.]NIN28510.1 NAD-binding protein [Hydrogenophaga sp.]NIN32969.1 NAD-binding protein [Hydrogenophaga sp.]NIN57644.1 NAD-binding protein [Hydrogenophaga sp.]NIO53939.1 NAD-binding protein [Hydrogenophaga sp.]